MGLMDTASPALRPAAPRIPEAARRAERQRARLLELLGEIAGLVPPEMAARLAALREELDGQAVRVSILGQVKAGKTALTNALIGKPGLLPSDVNPWTSVVTQIHLNTARPDRRAAVFRFFTSEDWAGMTERGGRLGEMTEAAGMEFEVAELREQIGAMQRRTEARLGRNFQMLLDGQHSFAGYSPELVEKYVCMGDEPGGEGGEGAADPAGRYADVTRQADLFAESADFVLPTVICDTPGVNDRFLVREAATLERLGEADICVLVLNANQALSDADMGLLRILRGMRSDQVVLFVNRVDQLASPSAQIPRIEAALREVLAGHGLDARMPVVFGSAVWAELASFGACDSVGSGSLEVLAALAEERAWRLEEGEDGGAGTAAAGEGPAPGGPGWNGAKATDLSGLHELRALVQERGAAGAAAPRLGRAARRASRLAQQSALLLEDALGERSSLREGLDVGRLVDDLDALLQQVDLACRETIEDASSEMLMLVSGAYHDFVSREAAALGRLIDAGGDPRDWQPDAAALHRELNSAYSRFAQAAPGKVAAVFDAAATRVGAIYADVLEEGANVFAVAAPRPEAPGAPTALMRTMQVDLCGGWASGWLRRRLRPSSFVDRFREVIGREMQEVAEEVRRIHIADFERRVRAQLHDFLSDHLAMLDGLQALDGAAQRSAIRRNLGLRTEIAGRAARLREAAAELEALRRAVGS
ncbi:dynamin family protein [Hasllibacter halocynthiae]|uniref:Dynamin family protein n=2 Tax=Hasllibacter halocynthiae TaxID=595589 RepID=A0A2T0WYY4_9RHOB|nr:dynamin family protein [Hasllibacter halocynthiae]